jgi:hypothetical protein
MLAKQNTGENAAKFFQGANEEYQDPKYYQDPSSDVPAAMPKRNRKEVAEVVIVENASLCRISLLSGT